MVWYRLIVSGLAKVFLLYNTVKRTTWMINHLLSSVSFENISLLLRRHHYRWFRCMFVVRFRRGDPCRHTGTRFCGLTQTINLIQSSLSKNNGYSGPSINPIPMGPNVYNCSIPKKTMEIYIWKYLLLLKLLVIYRFILVIKNIWN